MKQMKTGTIVFISGAFMNNNIWDEWRNFFKQNNFDTYAPEWPFNNGTSEELRNRHPNNEMATLCLEELLIQFEDFIRKLPGKPILIGHSLGGLLVQHLVQKDLAVAGVVIGSFYPKKIILQKISTLLYRLKTMGYLSNMNETYRISFSDWQHFIANDMKESDQINAFYDFSIPGSKLLARDTFWGSKSINFKKPHPPLLFISGSNDKITSSNLNFNNFKKYSHKESLTDYKEFTNRNHLTLIVIHWKDVASYILYWLSINITPETPKLHKGQNVHITVINKL